MGSESAGEASGRGRLTGAARASAATGSVTTSAGALGSSGLDVAALEAQEPARQRQPDAQAALPFVEGLDVDVIR